MALLPRAIADKIQRMLTSDERQSDGWKDATSGKLLEVGSFGLGVVSDTRLTDCNDASIGSINGFFVIDSGAANSPQAGSGYLWNQDWTSSSAYRRQMFFGASGGEIFYRIRAASVWSEWYTVFTQKSILGTVSQSGGVPTGAIIEQGSNANGSYIKYADGTMICHGVASLTGAVGTAWNSIFRSSSIVYTFPATFVGTPTCNGQLVWEESSLTSCMGCINYSTTSANSRFMLLHTVSLPTSGTKTVHYQAIGRWF